MGRKAANGPEMGTLVERLWVNEGVSVTEQTRGLRLQRGRGDL